MEGKRIGGALLLFSGQTADRSAFMPNRQHIGKERGDSLLYREKTEWRVIMKNMIYIGAASVNQAAMTNKKENKTEEPKSFKEQIAEMAKYKSPKEMTLQEYRQYLREKINRTILPFCGDNLHVSVTFSDMALVQMKSDPDLEKMVLNELWHELRKESRVKKTDYVEMNVQIYQMNEKKAEERAAQKRRILRKKKLELYFEKRAEQRENYTKFLETGRRYATPCPAIDLFKLMQSMGGFLGM